MPVNPSDIMSSAAERIQRTEAYAEQVRKMFAKTVNEILALNKTMPKLEEGVMFSFDGESAKKQKEVERLLRRLHSAATVAVKNGIELEWDKANEECDKLVSSAFGKAVLQSTMFSAWTQHNANAMQAFINRSEQGLNLSDRVWKSVVQLREEMEVAITVGIGEGQSAASMSRRVRQYLNDPDLMFRRFRYKDEGGEWRLKWKKRIKDEKAGKYKWIDYDKKSYQDEWTGKGYYKSSAQNAMRVTRTETNMAYHRADHERWQQMDFVLGQRIKLSHSHPREDICDGLQGDYPKEFVFDGWHPQCYSDDSEVLTQQGWKLLAEVQDDDRILSLNPETREIEYVGILDRQRYEKQGDMVHFFNRSLDCLVTPEHQMVYLNKSDGRIERCRADEFSANCGYLMLSAGCKMIASDFKKEIVPYSGYVYDLSLERNHIMYIRRNGKCFWGSNCFCFVTPILVDEDEMVKSNEAFLKGEKYVPQGKRVTEYPEDFKGWVKGHAEDIAKAREKGTEPYFIRNNKSIIDNILNPQPKRLTTQEKAQIRHDARTPEQRQFIIDRWKARKKDPLVIAANRHSSRTAAQIADIKNRWQQRKAQMQSTSNLDDVIKLLDNKKVDYLNVSLLNSPLSIDDIVKRVAGGDLTSGSCASLAFAYAGNRCGFDVLDFRGGKSLSVFSSSTTLTEIAKKVGGHTLTETNAFTAASALLKHVEKGKEYYFTCGRHAAIVRKSEKGTFEYLELQSSRDNGFKPLTTDVLKRRFGARKQYMRYGIKRKLHECLIDIELLKKDAQFRKVLGYINTEASKQKKGKSGRIK